MKRKGQFANVLWGLIPAALFVVVFGLILVYGTDIVQDVSDDQTADSYADNVSDETLEALTDMAEKQSTIVGVVVAGAIITILLAVFVMKKH